MKCFNRFNFLRLPRIPSVGVVAAGLLLLQSVAYSQNWQLVWNDEFNALVGPDWSFETGGGGWGNNEQEYYRPQNATIANFGGQTCLAITAKNESIGGYNYTSARMKTQGHRSWRYGKIVASICLPNFQGQWPAFWMLGDNIGSVGWPQCGELDIMEQINTAQTVYGSTHWYSGGQADWTSSANTSINNFHEYSVTWDPNYIKWYIDGNQYSQFYIGGNAGGTACFNQNNFFILLNMAVGGQWPGYSINNAALPASMYVDWISVYQDGGGLAQGRTFIIQNRNASKVLNASGAGTANDTPLISNTYNKGANCQWTAWSLGGNQWAFAGVQSGRYVNDPFASMADGTQLAIYDWLNAPSQKWVVTPTDHGYYQLQNVVSGKVMDVRGASTADGAVVQQYTANGSYAQQWAFLQP